MDITKKDNHKEDIDILLKDLDIAKVGVVHVGAHEGEEVEQYLAMGFKNIMLIEANPDVINSLHAKYGDNLNVHIKHLAVSDRRGTIDFHIHTSRSGNVEPASMLKMKEFDKIVPTLKTAKTITVPTSTLEDVFETEHAIADYNLLNIDVQGAEKLVLKGAEGVLSKFDAIICEVSLVELYEGAATEKEIVSFLEERNFNRKDCIYHELYDDEKSFKAWGECLFIKQKN